MDSVLFLQILFLVLVGLALAKQAAAGLNYLGFPIAV